MAQYWLVGATIDDKSHLEEFVLRGYWYMRNEKPHETLRRKQISRGDRIAIKKMVGGVGSPNVLIQALGEVIDNDLDEQRVYVRWVVTGLAREVPSQGAYDTIRGPFPADDEWTRRAFQL